MADTKISALTELTAPVVDDEYVVVDKSDTTMAGSGTDKRIKHQTLQQQFPTVDYLPPTGVTYEAFSRLNTTAATLTFTSGTLRMVGLWLPAGFSVSTTSFFSVGAASGGSSKNYWVALFDSSRALLRQATTNTAEAWAATAIKTTSLSSAFVTTYTGLHYCGINWTQAGGTLPTMLGMTLTASLTNQAPSITGPSSTGLAGTAPNPAAAITAGATSVPWCGVG